MSRDPAAAGRWLAGAEGERLTAMALRPFILGGAVLLHDRRIPGQRTNLDTMMFSPWGNFYFDSKMLSRTEIRMRGGVLYREGVPLDFSDSMREAMAVRNYVGCRVTPVVVVHGARVPASGLHPRTRWGGRILVTNWRGAWQAILRSPVRQDRERVGHLVARFQEHFTGYSASDTPQFWR